jgi:hypothetical protein
MIKLIEIVHKYPKESLAIGFSVILIIFVLCATIVEIIKLLKDK